MTVVKRCIKIVSIIFLEKKYFGPICAWEWYVFITLDLLQGIFFNFAQWRGPSRTADQTYFNNFSEEILVWSKWAILGPKIMHYLNSGSAQRFFFESSIFFLSFFWLHKIWLFWLNDFIPFLCLFRILKLRIFVARAKEEEIN